MGSASSLKQFPSKIDTSKLIRTFKLQATKIKKILDELDESKTNMPEGAYEYRKTAILFVPDAGENEQSAYLVATRYVSKTEVAFLLGGFFHTNRPIIVRLTTLFNAWEDLPGTVTSCRHVSASIHEAIVRFDHPIDPAVLTMEADSIRVLLVDDDPLFVKLGHKYLAELNATVDHAPNGEKGVEMAMAGLYDVVLMDLEMPVMDGLSAIKKLRTNGYAGTIIAVSGMTRDEVRNKCLEVGCDRFIGKPYTAESLSAAIRSVQGEPIYSTFEGDPEMRPIIGAFLEELPSRIRQLTLAAAEKNLKDCEIHLRSIKSAAGGYGFATIHELAAEVETKLIDGTEMTAVISDINQLSRMCSRVRSRQHGATQISNANGKADGNTNGANAIASANAPKTSEPIKQPDLSSK